LKVLLRIPTIWANFDTFCWNFFFIFIRNFRNKVFKMLYLL
jgi:hypothetical protein